MTPFKKYLRISWYSLCMLLFFGADKYLCNYTDVCVLTHMSVLIHMFWNHLHLIKIYLHIILFKWWVILHTLHTLVSFIQNTVSRRTVLHTEYCTWYQPSTRKSLIFLCQPLLRYRL